MIAAVRRARSCAKAGPTGAPAGARARPGPDLDPLAEHGPVGRADRRHRPRPSLQDPRGGRGVRRDRLRRDPREEVARAVAGAAAPELGGGAGGSHGEPARTRGPSVTRSATASLDRFFSSSPSPRTRVHGAARRTGATPRHPLIRFHGVLAPHSSWRAEVVPHPSPDIAPGTCPSTSQAPASPWRAATPAGELKVQSRPSDPGFPSALDPERVPAGELPRDPGSPMGREHPSRWHSAHDLPRHHSFSRFGIVSVLSHKPEAAR